MIFVISSLSFAGYDVGDFRTYRFIDRRRVKMMEDSVFLVDVWDGSGTRCSFSVDRAKYISKIYDSSSTVIDTNFVYFDGTFLVDVFRASFATIPIKHLKFPVVVGDWWQAIDTCYYPLLTYHPYTNIDGDSIIDSIFVDTSTARVLRVSGDTIDIFIGGINVKLKMTESTIIGIDTSSGDTTKYAHYEFIYEFNLKLRYIANFGYISFRIDTLIEKITWAIIHTAPYDSVQVPPMINSVETDYYIKEIPSTYISERRHLNLGEDVEIYDVSGRKVQRMKRGIYFIREGGKIRKVIKR